MVMLLRESLVKGLDELRKAGERAFAVPFSDDKESRYFVIQTVTIALMKVGRPTLSFLHYAKPYLDEGESREFGASMPKEIQRKAWEEHRAWLAVDYVKGGANLDLEYAVLAKLCLELNDENCAGIYLPREQIFVPNDGSLEPFLRRVAAAYKPNQA